MIFIASDHIGYKYKESIRAYLESKGYKIEDYGPKDDSVVDFTDYAKKVAKKVVTDPYYRGILFSGTGQGMCIAANKVRGAYAALVYNEQLAEKARSENNSNILCIATEFLSEASVKDIVSVWLSSSFSGTEESSRHIRQIKEIENEK